MRSKGQCVFSMKTAGFKICSGNSANRRKEKKGGEEHLSTGRLSLQQKTFYFFPFQYTRVLFGGNKMPLQRMALQIIPQQDGFFWKENWHCYTKGHTSNTRGPPWRLVMNQTCNQGVLICVFPPSQQVEERQPYQAMFARRAKEGETQSKCKSSFLKWNKIVLFFPPALTRVLRLGFLQGHFKLQGLECHLLCPLK